MKNKHQISKQTDNQKRVSLKNIQQLLFRTQLFLILSLALILGIAGTLINLHFETMKRDQNLQNVAEAIAHSPILTEKNVIITEDLTIFSEYLDTLKETLDDIDVISIINTDGIRVYHSNHSLIGTNYDGTIPNSKHYTKGYYAVNETGPSGNQRRAYAAIYNENDQIIGTVMAIMLMKNITQETIQMLFIFFIITVVAILIELIVASRLSDKVKKSLLGYEPDVFTTMYKMRDNILETLEEGILAVNKDGIIQFANSAAVCMLCNNPATNIVGHHINTLGDEILSHIILNGDKDQNINLANADIILDRTSLQEDDVTIGAIAILHNRAEYTKLMEDLSGTRYLVDSMRANNHDFTNKLHVILGLIQMEMYEEAISYIENITIVQRKTISKVVKTINEPAVAALLIGKIARASELNVKFILREGCCYCSADMHLPSEMLITVIGNLLDNAFEAMNECTDYTTQKELLFGIYSRPGAVLITVDDTGTGISKENIDFIFENGYSTKGKNRGTGLYQVQSLVKNFGGKITVETQEDVGTSFSISFTKED